jgi:diguanylate cyclase (GGDEF)-like protein
MIFSLAVIAKILVFLGLVILAGTLVLAQKLIAQLPAGQMRQKWFYQSALIVIFILGYAGYMIAFWNHDYKLSGMIVPGVFFFGSGFVWMTITISLQTALDIRRMTTLEHENISDPVIGIYNRRYLDRRLEEEFARARRYRQPLGLILIDIDHFKQVNDLHGHPTGDQVLHCWGDIIMNNVRASDIVARYGGDEVLIIAPGTTSGEAFALAERIRASVETCNIKPDNIPQQNPAIQFTVSIGVAGLSAGTESVAQLLQVVDLALYEAKNAGRNRVMMSS